jgi:hypothetical protein
VESAIGAAVVAWLAVRIVIRKLPGRLGAATLLGVPVVALFLASALSGKAYNVRYALTGLIGFLILSAAALHELPWKVRPAAVAAMVAVLVWADVQWYVSPVYWKDDSRAAVSWLAARLPPGSSVAVAPGYGVGLLSHYAAVQNADLHFLPAESPAAATGPTALLLTRLHHVADQASLEEAFRRGGLGVREDTVGGYYILAKIVPTPAGPKP